jgi:NAD dependent epimerase/dehydratase family enzyme
MSWVSEADAVSAVLFALGVSDAEKRPLCGPVNVVAPEAMTNAAFTQELGHAMHRPALLPAPAFALRLAFGEMADAALLASTRAVPKRLLDAGFVFTHPTLPEALAAALAS